MKVNNPNLSAKQRERDKEINRRIELSQYYRDEIYKSIGVPLKYFGNENK